MPNIINPNQRTALGNLKQGYRHSSKQKGWADTESSVGYSRTNQLQDEEYYLSLALHDPLWRYILARFNKEIYDFQNTALINVLGYRALPISIELSQWGYEVNQLCLTDEERQRTIKDLEKQAGKLKQNLWFNYYNNCPRGAAVCFIGIVDELRNDEDIFKFLDMLLRRNIEVVFAVYNNRDWRKFFDGKYDFYHKKYPEKPFSLIVLRGLEQAVAFQDLQP